MYASNEDEDWIYLHKTPPVNSIDQKCFSLSKSNRSISLSSISSTDNSIEQENENDIFNTGFELSNDSISISKSKPISQDIQPRKRYENKNDILVSCTCLLVLLTLPFILGQILTQWHQPSMSIIANELIKTNQRLNEITDIPIGNLEKKLTKQFENKIPNLINQQLTWHEYEKSLFISQIIGLREVLNKTQQNLTNTIQQLIKENKRLEEQIQLLEYRLAVTEEQYPKNRNKSSRLTLKKLFTNIFKTDTSISLSGLFDHLSASVSNIIDHRSSIAKKIQISKSTYSTWLTSHTRARMNKKKFPWRWPSKEHVCYSKFSFPINKICSMKNWMIKLFRS